jgi:lambda family phage portal protein
MTPTWLDRLTALIAPMWTFRRQRARIAGELLVRHYEAATAGRRTQGWARAGATDANAANMSGLARLREVARDLVRNNAYAESALSTIVDHCCGGWGIVAKPNKTSSTAAARNQAAARWAAWADTTACDAEGRLDFAGLQKQVMRTAVEAGEVLVRRRWRRPEDGLPIPMQLQILEPDYLDSQRDGITTPSGGRIIQGIEFDAIGRRVGYWLFAEHPGSAFQSTRSPGASRVIPASEILHIYKHGRPGQIRGASWFAPVTLTLKDLDDYEDAALMKQKIAACLAVVTSDLDGTSPALGTTTPTAPGIDMLEPGMILNVAPGRSITVVDPPSVNEHDTYAKTVLRKIATGLGVTYEDLTGDYAGMPFSAARMSRLRHWTRVEDWRWRMLIPQLCDPVWRWAMEAAVVGGMQVPVGALPTAEWTAPAAPMIDPEAEAKAYQLAMRIGAITWPDMVRERGYDPEAQLAEIAEWNAKFDRAKVILDSDPRVTSQQGQPREATAEAATPTLAPTAPNGNGSRP